MNVKRWLEATMRFEVRYTAYDQAVRVTLPLLTGSTKIFDMIAQHFEPDLSHTASGRDVYVEVKNVHTFGSAKKQVGQYKEFVATAYSATEAAWDQLGQDPVLDFMWASMHPWEVQKYVELTTPAFVMECCTEHSELLAGRELVAEKLATLASRLWIWLIPKRQDDMTMGEVHRGHVLSGIVGP